LALAVSFWGHSSFAHHGLDPDIRDATRRLEREPASVEALLDRGHLYRLAGQFEASLQDLSKARALAPQDAAVHFQLGLTLSALRRDAEAMRELELAVSRGLVSDVAHFELGSIHRRAHRYEQAIAEFRMCLVINGVPKNHLALGQTLSEGGRLDEAIRVYQTGYEQTRGEGLLRAWVSAELAQGNHQRALQLMSDVWKRKVIAVQWYLLRAQIIEASGKARKARQIRKAALRVANVRVRSNPNAANLLDRAAAREALGYRESALQDAQRALKQAPADDTAREVVERLARTSGAP